MASKGKGSSIHIVVCGLTSSSFQGLSGQGAGKSYLCNRFVRPKFDDLKEHTSVLNNSDFGSNIINTTHFLYWGEKVVGLEDGQDVRFQLVEHTEFVDDASLKPFSYTKPYHKRCTQLKLQSGGKIMYINNDQLALPEEYTRVDKFPDKFHVDGFIVCVDVSTQFDDPSDPQKDFVSRLLASLQQSKKPMVVAMTKFDQAIDSSVASVSEIVSKAKKQIPIVEVSASKGVNVDMCFLVLCHLVDPKTPKTRIISYADAKSHLDDRIRKIETAFQDVLDKSVGDFSLSVYQVCNQLQSNVDYLLLCELKGIDRVHRLIRGKLAYLKKLKIGAKLTCYQELLPCILDVLIPKLSLNDNIESCCRAIRSSKKFIQYIVDIKDWRNDTAFLKSTNDDVVPFGLLEEDVGVEILQSHIDKVLKSAREQVAFDKIRDIMRNAKGLLPGTVQQQLWEELGVVEDATLIPPDRLTKLYLEQMTEVEKECVTDLGELLLESIALFEDGDEDSQKTLDRIDRELKDRDRYKRFDRRADVRKAHVLKHIGSVQVGGRWSYSQSHAIDALEKLQEEGKLRKEGLNPPPGSRRALDDLQWSVYPEGEEYFNLSLMARTLDNALTLRSDFMNHLSGDCLFEANGFSYRLEMSLFHGEDGPITTMTNLDFVPDGAFAVVNSMECLDWLEDLVGRLWIPSLEAGLTQPPYRGMPLVILALDKTAAASAETNQEEDATPLHKRARAIANSVQSICLRERPTVQPKRLVVSTVIHQLLTSLIDTVISTRKFFTEELSQQDHLGLNIAVCTLCGDQYPALSLLSPWLRHQAVYCNRGNQTLFLNSNLDATLRTCTLTFHSALNVKEILSFTRLGFTFVYSTSRPASLAVVKFLIAKLPNLPKMIIAMVSDEAHDSHMIEEGRALAKKWSAAFFCSSDEEWAIGCTSEFFSKCWFVRFSSWNNQEMPDVVRVKLREKRQARALPTRPTFDRDSPLPLPPMELPKPRERHSLAALLDTVSRDDVGDDPYATPPFLSGTIPRSPARPKYTKPTSLTSPPIVTTPSPINDMGIYSDPIAPRIGMKQKKASTLERNKLLSTSSDQFLFPGSPPVLGSPDVLNRDDHDHGFSLSLGAAPESDYASVNDALSGQKLSLSMVGTLERQRLSIKSPSMSPPPIPLSPTETDDSVLNGDTDEDTGDLYATVDTNRKRTRPKIARGYDHLEKSPEIPRKRPGYDHLPPQVPIRTDSLSKVSSPPPDVSTVTINLKRKTSAIEPLPDMYATVDKHRAPVADPIGDMYATVDKHRAPVADPIGDMYATVDKHRAPVADPTGDLYATVDKSAKTKRQPQLYPTVHKTHNRHKSADTSLEDVGALYSTVQKKPPRTRPKPPLRRPVTPDEPLYSMPDKRAGGKKTPPLPVDGKKTPPPIAPKPRSRRSPTPTGQHRAPILAHLRSESFDTGVTHKVRTKPPLLTDMRGIRSHSMDKKGPLKSPIMQAVHMDVDKRVASLPKNYRHRTGSLNDDLDGCGFLSRSLDYYNDYDEDENGENPALPERKYSASELDLEDEPPPLPPRIYHWSDMEDNDDELFQSDDDLDDPLTKWSVSDQQKLYASIAQATQRSPSVSGVESIYHVVNKMIVIEQHEDTPSTVQVARQPSLTVEEESAYDTLQNVLKTMRGERHTPFSSSLVPQPTNERSSPGASKPAPSMNEKTNLPSDKAMPLTAAEIKNLQKTQKLLKKLEKKAQREAERRHAQEARKRKRQEEETRKKDGKKRGKKGKKQPERARYFGSPLDKVVDSSGVPVFVRKCVDFVEGMGLKVEGIYRVPGKKENCLLLQDKFEEDQSLDIKSLDLYESAISSTLKAFFKLLPDPLIPNNISDQLLAVNSLDTDSQKTRIHELLSSLQRPNLKTLKFMMEHLHKVQQLHEFNKMTPSNLSIVFWPTLLRPPLQDLADPSKQLGWQLLMTRIIERPDFVPDTD